jgi:hypothetical protein
MPEKFHDRLWLFSSLHSRIAALRRPEFTGAYEMTGFQSADPSDAPDELAVSSEGDFRPAVSGEVGGVFQFWKAVPAWLPASAAAGVMALAMMWLEFGGSASGELARDYEECLERLQTQSASADETNGGLTGCGARFAGRRKPDGGYSYYDFMQDRKFDIAGPNPTADERKAIDREYIGYLEVQRREAISAALAKQQNDLLRADIETARAPAGQPLALVPTNVPLPVPRRVAEQREKARQCAEDSLLCTLSKLSGAVKDAFASSPKTKN